MQVSDYRVIIG